MKFVADNQSAEPVQPSKQPLHGPAAQVAPQRSAVLHSAPVLTVGRNHLDSVFLAQMPVQRVRVIRLVADRLFAQLVEQAAGQGTADTSPATPATVLPCAESKALRSTAHAYRPAADPARQSASPLGKPQQRLQHRPLSIRHLARCVHLRFADSPKLLPLCRHRAENTRENRPQVFIGQVLKLLG